MADQDWLDAYLGSLAAPFVGISPALAGAGASIGNRRRAGKPRNPLEDQSDADVVDPAPEGMFTSFLDSVGKPGHAVNDALMGNFAGAGRQVVDLLGDVIDAPLPGDWIPHISKRKDKADFSDVVGGMEPGFGKFAVDLVGGALTDPTTYIPGAVVGKGLGAIGKVAGKVGGLAERAVSKLPKGAALVDAVKDTAAETGRNVRSVFGAQRISPETRAILDNASAAKNAESQAGIGAIKGSVLGTLSEPEAGVVSDVLDNLNWKDGKVVGRLGPESEDPMMLLARHPEVTPENLPRMRDAVAEAMHIGQQQAKRSNIFSKRSAPDPLLFGASEAPQTAFKGDYLPRTYTGQTEEQAIDQLLGQEGGRLGTPNPIKELKLDTPEAIAEHLQENPKVAFDHNAVSRLGKRAEAQGTLAQRAEIGKSILGDSFSYADPEMRAGVEEHIRGMAAAAPEDAKMLLDAFKGHAPRGKVMNFLAKTNRVFKPAAVYGFAVPKFGSIVRNAVSGVWQAASNPESRGVAMQQLGKLDQTLAGAVADSLGLTYPRDRLAKTLRAVDQAFSQGGGLADNALGILERAGTKEAEQAAGMIRSGVLDGFVTSEGMVKEMARSPLKKKLASIADWPARMFRGVEDRMRAGMYLDLVKRGKPPAAAAKIVRDSLYDYSVASVGNRRARDIIPFFQFGAKAIPQQAKFLAEQPKVAGALSRAFERDPDQPVYPYMEGKLNVPLGKDEAGDEQVASGFGLPFEALNQIPNSWRDFKRNVIGSSQPLLKTAFARASGEDPYFETPVDSYTKVPIAGDLGSAGSAYNAVAGTGLIQPLDSPLRFIDQLIDGRRGAGVKALDMLTGAKVTSVNKDLALQQQLQQLLKSNPDVRQYRGYYSDQGDDSTDALIKAFQEAKARVKKKRKSAAP